MGSHDRQGDTRPAIRRRVAGRHSRTSPRTWNAVALAFLFAALGDVTRAQAQRLDPHPALHRGQLPVRDSLRYLAEAHRAQSAFERYRRANLPRRQPSDVKPCDVKIGRFCYWHNPGDRPVEEPPKIIRARDQLIRTLGALNERSRADRWISGERVRYLVEAGYDSSAIVASRECWSAQWWCNTLHGFALHAAQRYEDAGAMFDSALAAMPQSERCAWRDVSLLLTDDDRARYVKLPCDSPERNEFERRFWQLADPSYVIPGNDRRTEHFARMLLVTLAPTAQNAYGLSWGDDLRELTIRYGTPITYSTTWGTWPGSAAPLVGHEREPSYHFAALDAASDIARWDVRAEQARERYSPVYMDSLTDLDAQFGMFRRGDSALVVAIYAKTGDSSTLRDLDAALGVTDSKSVAVSTSDTMGVANVRTVRAPWKGVVVGVEQYNAQARQAQRARRWLAPPNAPEGAPHLSTLLFYDGTDTSAVTSLQDAIRRARTSEVLKETRKLGVYWEVYDTTAANDSTVSVAMTVTRTDGGILKWFAQTLHLTPRDAPLAISWHDIRGDGGLSYRSVVLDLAQLAPGTYRVDLAVGPDDARRTVSSREILLR
jgi:hypothetical protein